MDLPRSVLKDFAKLVTPVNETTPEEKKYVKGTVKSSDDVKYVQIDGSSTLTPISEVVDVEDGDRVLVTIENHTATIIGNFTFPPSARKEQEAIDKADSAQESANNANEAASNASELANSASQKADTAIENASVANQYAEEAKQSAQEAMTAAETANQNATDAKESATNASNAAQTAREEAAKAQQAAAGAQNEVDRINGEITDVKEDISDALTQVADQAAATEAIKETLKTSYATKTEVSTVEANLTTEISKKVGELQTTVEQNYAAKNEVTALEGRLQTQITQNAEGLTSTSQKVEKLESDTTEAQKQVNIALENAANAQAAAEKAQSDAAQAQSDADLAKENAETADKKAQAASDSALDAEMAAHVADEALAAARTDLNEARQNYESVVNNPESTTEEIEAAQKRVDEATKAVKTALENAAEAAYVADQAQNAANKAAEDAAQAQVDATNAQLKADNASTAAQAATDKANQAQADVAALTKRVESAETNITQNAEKIELSANKVEEIGDKLINDYYTKNETDAKIKVSADSITSTVNTTITEEIGKVQIGGRNLLFHSSMIGEELVFDNLLTMNKVLSHEYTNEGWHFTTPDSSVSGSNPNNAYGFQFNDWRTLGINAEDTLIFSLDIKGTWEGNDNPNFRPYIQIKISTNINTDPPSETNPTNWLNGSGSEKKFIDLKEDWQRVYVIWTLPEASVFVSYGLILGCHGSYGGDIYIRNLKLEKGTKPTDWSPAPEDKASSSDITDLEEKTESNEARISVSESTIQQLSDSISTLVTDENGNSMMTQTSDGWTFNIGEINETLNNAKDELNNLAGSVDEVDNTIKNINSLVNDLSQKTAYIVMTTDETGAPCIELGKSDNNFKVRITNTSVDFLDGSTRVAYISNESLYITRAVIKDELQIGEGTGYIWKRRANGNMGLRYIRGDS